QVAPGRTAAGMTCRVVSSVEVPGVVGDGAVGGAGACDAGPPERPVFGPRVLTGRDSPRAAIPMTKQQCRDRESSRYIAPRDGAPASGGGGRVSVFAPAQPPVLAPGVV